MQPELQPLNSQRAALTRNARRLDVATLLCNAYPEALTREQLGIVGKGGGNPLPWLIKEGYAYSVGKGKYKYQIDHTVPQPCPKCGSTVAVGANIHECAKCGDDCCTACTEDGPDNTVECDDCHVPDEHEVEEACPEEGAAPPRLVDAMSGLTTSERIEWELFTGERPAFRSGCS